MDNHYDRRKYNCQFFWDFTIVTTRNTEEGGDFMIEYQHNEEKPDQKPTTYPTTDPAKKVNKVNKKWLHNY